MNDKIAIIKVILITILLSNCSFLDKYHFNTDFLKESYINQSNLDKIFIGMTKKQVIYIFGEPIISDSFSNEYHYLIYNKKNKNLLQRQTLNLIFKKDKLFNFNIQ